MRRGLMLLAIGAGLLGLGACDFGASPAASPSASATAITTSADESMGLDACRLATASDVSAALDTRVGGGRRQHTLFYALSATGVPAEACDYTLLGREGRVRLRVTDRRAAELFSHVRRSTSPVTGIGAQATWQAPGNTLWVLKGKMLLAIEIPVQARAKAPRQSAVEIAGDAIPRMGR